MSSVTKNNIVGLLQGTLLFSNRIDASDKVRDFISQFWADANDFEIEILLNQFTDSSFEEFVFSSGATPQEIKEVMQEYDRLTGKTTKSKGKKAGKPKA